jgi:hypothetical protein
VSRCESSNDGMTVNENVDWFLRYLTTMFQLTYRWMIWDDDDGWWMGKDLEGGDLSHFENIIPVFLWRQCGLNYRTSLEHSVSPPKIELDTSWIQVQKRYRCSYLLDKRMWKEVLMAYFTALFPNILKHWWKPQKSQNSLSPCRE